MISHIHNEILKQKNVTGSGLEGAPKLLKIFYSRLFLCQTVRYSKFQRGQLYSHKKLKFKTVSVFFEILKTFQVITIKLRPFRLRKCYFGVLVVKCKQSGLSKNADTALDKE